jgi:hypothetical protein
MRILFLHPEDDPVRGPWARQRWDRVIDLGLAGSETYARWSHWFHCPVESIGFARSDVSRAREAFAAGRGLLVDALGVDWWEVISVRYNSPLLQAVAVENIAKTIRPEDELFASRPDFHAQVLQALLGRGVQPLTSATLNSRVLGAWKRFRKLSYPQIKQIFWDKYDPEYGIRQHLSPARRGSRRSFILLPSAYVNVSRMALAYAKTLPGSDFLLVNARRSGRHRRVPENVLQIDLSSYVESGYPSREYDDLVDRWKRMRNQLRDNHLLRLLSDVGVLDRFAQELRQWLQVRNGWHNVYEREDITAVLSCDSSNPYTHIPLLLGKARGLPSIASHHGALDGQNLLKTTKADVVLAKGTMERDYLLRRCKLPAGRVEVVAPTKLLPKTRREGGNAIVFFSEDYEVSGGRVEDYYREVLPRLAEVATMFSKRLILKLHPAESMKERRRMVNRVLRGEQRQILELVAGDLTPDLMQDIWFAVTVISTTAVDCALHRIPVFLCAWLENWPYQYAEQFCRFHIATPLREPHQILSIPASLRNYSFCEQRELWEEAPHRLQQLLRNAPKSELALAL